MSLNTQENQVIEKLRDEGGYATLRRLNEIVDFSTWKTKTPAATIRRIVQQSKNIFRIQPGLWALEEMREVVFDKFDLISGNKKSEEHFSHSYYQGLLVEIGKMQKFDTYVPAQDKNRKFLHKKLGDMIDVVELPKFTYDNLLKRARTVDVIWFNERNMPTSFYEVEHTTDIKNSLTKFYELQDFHSNFYIVADQHRRREYNEKLHTSIFAPIEKRVKFIDYNNVVSMYEGMTKIHSSNWNL